jgi:hypothetical protein
MGNEVSIVKAAGEANFRTVVSISARSFAAERHGGLYKAQNRHRAVPPFDAKQRFSTLISGSQPGMF